MPSPARVRALLVIALLGCACSHGTATVRFPHTDQVVPNPERGLFVDVDLIKGRDFSYVRAQGYTLGFAGVRLDDYRGDVLPIAFLDALTQGFAAVRAAGIKVILRFVYNDVLGGEDASRSQILVHLAQLRPILEANADVIAVMDAGFIGAWGEWHSSTNRLDNAAARYEILAAILDALPASRSATVRSPIYKRQAFGGPLDAARAFDGSAAARVGHHNSCFLASDTDQGTYADPVESWKDFVAAEGRFTPVGGETCALDPPRTNCETAIAELARLHWSFLNAQYHRDVLATWQSQGCYQRIARDLGYRIELDSVSYDERVAPGGVLHVTIHLANTGYAAMYNARPVYITLDDWSAQIPVDPRRWEPGKPVTISARLRVPADAKPGRHRLGLWLPDADVRLRAPEVVGAYSVRLPNAGWAAPINVLTEDLVIDPKAPGPVDPVATELAWLHGST